MSRVLVVEDSQLSREFIRLAINMRPNFHILEAVNGKEALVIIKKEDVDIVVTDINMPVMDGIELIRQIRTTSGLEKLPVIVVSTKGENESVQEALEAGANGFVTKPVRGSELIESLDRLLASDS